MTSRIPDAYAKLRGAIPFDQVSVGHSSIELVPVRELQSAQQGYGGDDSGWQSES